MTDSLTTRRQWLCGLAGSALPFIGSPSAEAAAQPPVINAPSAILIDAKNGRVLWEKNSTAPRAVASTQKLLTALIVAEGGGLNDRVTVAASDTWVEPTKIGLKSGHRYGRGYLMQAMLVKSCNDIARCLARNYAGSEEGFGQVMTKRAKRLGCSNSYFVNASGLPARGQHSTARDMAAIARAAYQIPVIKQIIRIRYLTFNYADGRKTTLENTNRLMRECSYVTGMKTGYTNAAGKCLVSSAEANGRSVIAVLLGSGGPAVWAESKKLLDYGLTV